MGSTNKRKAKTMAFIEQVKINDKHQFDHIQTLWKVADENVVVDYNWRIGKGTQSIVYIGN